MIDIEFNKRRGGFIVLLALGVVALALWPTLSGLVLLWDDTDPYTHGPLLFLVGLWLIWQKRRQIAHANWKPCWWFLLPIVFIAALSLVPITNLRLFVLPLSVLSLIGLIAGPGVVRLVAFPVLLVHFALPGWGFCLPILLGWTTAVVTVALELVNIPALIESQYVSIPAGRFVIEEGCAGMKYFVAGGALSAIFAYLYIKRPGRRLLMIAIGFAFAIIANWVRVFGIIVVGHLTNMQSSLVHDHNFFGWVIFGLALVPLFWIGGRLASPETRVADTSGEGSQAPALRMLVAAVTGVILLGLAPVLARGIPRPDYKTIEMPEQLSGYARLDSRPIWRPALNGAAQREHTQYRRDDRTINVSVGLYAGGRKTELINETELFAHLRGWRNIGESDHAVGKGHNALQVRERELSHKRGARRLTWHWYHVGGLTTSNRNVARLYSTRALISGRRDAAQVVLTATCGSDCEMARSALEQFLIEALPALDESLARAGDKENSE